MSSIEDWLKSVGLGQYSKVFIENDVDLRALPHLNGEDLRDLGVSLGHRKIMLAAIATVRERETPQNDVGRNLTDRLRPGASAELGPELRLISVLFCDMVGSTDLSAQFSAEEMHDLIIQYQGAVADSIKQLGGYVAKFLGDGVLAYFGWPASYEDHAERAIRAAFKAIERVTSLTTPAGVQLRSRVGIASGRVVVGDLVGGGALDRGQVAGETPNLAARLQSVANPGQVIIAESTHRLAGHAFEIQALGVHELKGFRVPVPAFRVVRERDIDNRFDAMRGKSLSQFVGRNSEIGILLDRWELAKSSQGQAVFVSGEAGIGKSRLLEALIERVREEPQELIRLQCSPYHSTSALYPVIQRLTRAFELASSHDESTRLQNFERLLAQYGENRADVAPVYAELLTLDLGERYKLPDMTAQQRKELTLRTLADRIFLAAKKAPVLLVVEDAHWVDPSTSELLRDLVLRIHRAPIYLLVTHRPEWSVDWAQGQSHVTTFPVGRLTNQQMRMFIRSILGVVSDELVNHIVGRTDGVPLFVEEVARSIVESGTEAPESVDIPDSLQGLLMERLDRLSSSSKEVAQIASVIGREFDRDLLAQVARLNVLALEEALHQLLAVQLIVMSGPSQQSLAFRHALIQDAVYQSLLTRKRLQYHREIAEAIVESHPNIAVSQPELVARHFSESGSSDLALPYWKKAGERALTRSANYEASDHFSNALAAAERIPVGSAQTVEILAVKLRLAEALTEAGRFRAAIDHYRTVAEQARAADDTDSIVRVAVGYDTAQFLLGMPANESVARLTHAEAKLARDDERRRCLILSRLTRALLLTGEKDKSESLEKQATELALRMDDRSSLFNIFANRFLLPRQVQSSNEVQTLLAQATQLIELSQTVDDDEMKTRALSIHAYISTELGDRARVDQSFASLMELGEVRQRLNIQWVSRHFSAMMAIVDGKFASAETYAGEGLKLGRLTLGDQVEGVYGIQMFSIRREQGRLADVAPVIKRLIDENPGEKAWLPGFALIAAELGFTAPARRRLDELAETGFEMPADAKRSASLSYIAEVAALLDDQNAAATLYELLSAYGLMTITTGIVTVCYGAASRYLGLLAATLGDFDKAEAHFEHALQMNAAFRCRPWHAHTQAQYAKLLRRRARRGDSERADSLSNEAWKTAAELDMVLLQQKLQMRIQ
jgi:predicted ATPase/class 3 adenylate cyclase